MTRLRLYRTTCSSIISRGEKTNNPQIEKKMKAIFATAAIMISLLGVGLSAADSTPVILCAEQQFQQADLQLAIEQYKKLRMAAFEIGLKLHTDKVQSEEQRVQLNETRDYLEAYAGKLRAETLTAAAAALAKSH
jgi:hypothetical protein